MSRWTADKIPDLTGKIAIVTGANTGLGLETTRQLARKGARVIMACRDEDKARAARDGLTDTPKERLEVRALDLADLDSVAAFARWANDTLDRLDLLVNNAGVMMCPESRTAQGFELQLGVNHLGHFALTAQLFDLLERSAGRVVNVSSGAHRFGRMAFEDLNFETRAYDRSQAYGQSKLANLLFTSELARRTAEAGSSVTVTAAHPGWTATDLQRHVGLAQFLNHFVAMSVEKGALPQLRAAVEDELASDTYMGPGGFYEMWGYPEEVSRSERARDAEAARRLWERSESLTGVSFDVARTEAVSA